MEQDSETTENTLPRGVFYNRLFKTSPTLIASVRSQNITPVKFFYWNFYFSYMETEKENLYLLLPRGTLQHGNLRKRHEKKKCNLGLGQSSFNINKHP